MKTVFFTFEDFKDAAIATGCEEVYYTVRENYRLKGVLDPAEVLTAIQAAEIDREDEYVLYDSLEAAEEGLKELGIYTDQWENYNETTVSAHALYKAVIEDEDIEDYEFISYAELKPDQFDPLEWDFSDPTEEEF